MSRTAVVAALAAVAIAAAIVCAAPSFAEQSGDAARGFTPIGAASIEEHRGAPAPSALAGAAVLLGMIVTVSRGRRKPQGMGPLGLNHEHAEVRDSYTL